MQTYDSSLKITAVNDGISVLTENRIPFTLVIVEREVKILLYRNLQKKRL
ncbi:hypothetical protein GCM10010978_30740 [Compostibacillus humi]|uniref:Uncharacterized protein n=1 Tax=Compostibacillus humi TaxID=1245525 RepID=A0A8J2TTC0_9BACI|nr:hypothetical protein [Compostibacillus humi]GFZ89169.1 hypothetical protein GCM10010978_30740 [Compostibacillus humi]